jgi:hypothetical protein
MAMLRLELSDDQVVALAGQLSLPAKAAVLRLLASELNAADQMTPLEVDQVWSEVWEEDEEEEEEEEDEFEDDYPALDRRELLAAETFSYSYANYDNHLGIGNVRFDELMPNDVDILEQAEQEEWEDDRLAESLGVPAEQVGLWRESYRRAKEIVDAPTPAESFRRGVRYSIHDALAQGLNDEEAIEGLVTQICYRAADLAYLLDLEEELLSEYSEDLRRTPDSVQSRIIRQSED